MSSLAPTLPLLAEISTSTDLTEHRDTLTWIYEVLQSAEESLPPAGIEAPPSDGELAVIYGSAVRELSYGTRLLVDGAESGEERLLDSGRRFLERGLRGFERARERFSAPAAAPLHEQQDQQELGPAVDHESAEPP